MRALKICCSSHEASIKRLKDRIESKVDNLKKSKDSSHALGQEVNDLKAKLSRIGRQTDYLVKENANLKFEVAALNEHIEKVKEEVIEEYQVSQFYFHEMGGYYEDGFEDFCKQVVLMFPNLGFSQIQIKLIALSTPAVEPIPNDVEIDKEVVVTDWPSGATDDPMNPQEQTNNPPSDP